MEIKFFKTLQQRLGDENLSRLARELGISKALLHDWVRAKRYPSLRNIEALYKLAEHLDLSLEALIFGKVASKDKVISSVFFEDGGKKYNVQIKRLKDD